MEKKSLRMYSLVLYNLSPIQQGIQSWHACMELMNKGRTPIATPSGIDYKSLRNVDPEFLERSFDHKTVVILNGGTSSSLESHIQYLHDSGVKIGVFQEPDLGGITTAVAFIAENDSNVCKYFTPLFKLA